MRPSGSAGLSLLLVAGCATAHEEHYLPGVPYACEEGGDARVIYRAGGASEAPRARLHHNGHVYELTANPSEYGLRYVSSDTDPILTWSLNGEAAMLSTIARDAPTDAVAREIACPRRRDGNAEVAPGAAEPPHH